MSTGQMALGSASFGSPLPPAGLVSWVEFTICREGRAPPGACPYPSGAGPGSWPIGEGLGPKDTPEAQAGWSLPLPELPVGGGIANQNLPESFLAGNLETAPFMTFSRGRGRGDWRGFRAMTLFV